MTFAEIRTEFIKLSGRGDFADAAGSDAEFFIKAGYDYLSSLVPTVNKYGDIVNTQTAGSVTLTLNESRAIKQLYRHDGSLRVKLTKITYEEFLAKFGGNDSSGVPSYWAPFTKANGNCAKLGPKPAADTTITAVTLKYDRFRDSTPADWAETESTWLSINYPDLIIQACLYKLEIFYRNMEGAKGWLEGIKEGIRGIDFDIVETEMSDVSTMTEQYKLDRRL